MGRYKKSKISGDVAVVEVPPSLGVRTRAKTLALQPDSSYLQLRNRRLEKTFLGSETKTPKLDEKVKKNRKSTEEVYFGQKDQVFGVSCEVNECALEASCGENCLEFEARERSTRESTPCSLLRDPDTIATPGSSTRLRNSMATYQRQSSMQRYVPTAREMEEFFAFAEQQQQKLFMEKYNFDVVNDLPLGGRYEWIPVNP